MASVGSRSGGSTNIFLNQFCGGMLVSPDYVLTAGHCTIGLNASDLEIVVGVTDLTDATGAARRRNVTEIILHPDYRETPIGDVFSDLALLRLDRPITDIAPIPIADSATTTVGTPVKALGWGDTTDDEFTVSFPELLQEVDLVTVSQARLQSEFGNIIDLQHLGAFGDDRDTCQGDSGGPLFIESPLTLVGVTSFGIGCGDLTAGVYANVGFLSDFITSTIGGSVSIVLGDVNVDGGVNFLDISPFIAALLTGTFQAEADVDQNGSVNFLDIAPFVLVLRGQEF